MGPALAAALSPTRGEQASLTPLRVLQAESGGARHPCCTAEGGQEGQLETEVHHRPHRGAHAAPQEGETALAAGWRHI